MNKLIPNQSHCYLVDIIPHHSLINNKHKHDMFLKINDSIQILLTNYMKMCQITSLGSTVYTGPDDFSGIIQP